MLLKKSLSLPFLSKSSLLVILAFVINACSSVDFNYISRDKIKSASFASEKPRYAEEDTRPMQLGGIRMVSQDANEGDAGRLLILQRKHGVYMAETKIDSDSKRRYFFSVGVDPRSKTPAIGFRMEF